MKKYLAIYIILVLVLLLQAVPTLSANTTSEVAPSYDPYNTPYLPQPDDPDPSKDPIISDGDTTISGGPGIPQPTTPPWLEFACDCENHTHHYPTEAYVIDENAYNAQWVVICRKLNVRPTASTKEAAIAQLSRGQTVQVLSIDNSWAKIVHNGHAAYVYAKYIALVG